MAKPDTLGLILSNNNSVLLRMDEESEKGESILLYAHERGKKSSRKHDL